MGRAVDECVEPSKSFPNLFKNRPLGICSNSEEDPQWWKGRDLYLIVEANNLANKTVSKRPRLGEVMSEGEIPPAVKRGKACILSVGWILEAQRKKTKNYHIKMVPRRVTLSLQSGTDRLRPGNFQGRFPPKCLWNDAASGRNDIGTKTVRKYKNGRDPPQNNYDRDLILCANHDRATL
jgi:hypothetical protein